VLLGCPDGISKSPDLKAKNNKKKMQRTQLGEKFFEACARLATSHH